MEKIKTEKVGKCNKAYIPKKYCCVYLKGRANAYVEVVKEGNDLCIEVLEPDLECQKAPKGNKKRWKW